MGIFDIFKSDKKQKNQSKYSRDMSPSQIMALKSKEKDYVPKKLTSSVDPEEVSLIIKPRVSKKGIITFYDLRGSKITKVTKQKRDIAIESDCYLGLKKYKTAERWEPIESEDVEKYLDDEKFCFDHSQKTKSEILAERREIAKTKKARLVSAINAEFEKLQLDKKGNIILIPNSDFQTILQKHQTKIIDIDRKYIQQFVKVSSYLKTKENNIRIIFKNIKKVKNQNELKTFIGIMRNEIHSYELIFVHSLNMVVSLINDEMITFYEIYESFDKLKMFNNEWENNISNKLSDIKTGIGDINKNLENLGQTLSGIMFSIQKMEMSIVEEIGNLTYITQQSFNHLNKSVTSELKSIKSSIQYNNLLTTVNTYQLYSINKKL